MFKVFANAFKVEDIRKRLFYVLLILAIYRVGCHIPVPGIDLTYWSNINSVVKDSGITLAALFGGGTGTIFSMGIGPYITSSIIMQLLTVAIPQLERMQKEGKEGRDKIKQYTRILAVAMSAIQAVSSVYMLIHHTISTQSGTQVVNMFGVNAGYFAYFLAIVSMTAGTIFIMWLSEILAEKGFKNGGSFIIYANILSGFPRQVTSILYSLAPIPKDIIIGALLLILFIGVVAFSVLVQDGERRLPVQYSKKMVGRQLTGGQSSFIPLKVNIAGVMSIIFAVSVIQLPLVLSGFFHTPFLTNLNNILKHTHPVGALVYVVLIFCFTFFYTSFAINPNEMSDNIKKNGGAIPGIRPGKATSDYIARTVYRLSWIGACFYSLIAMIPVLFEIALQKPVGFGGTTLLIVSSVALEIVKQLESQLLMRHYKGFLN